MDFRRILLFITLLAAAGGIGFALYWFFFRAPATPIDPTEPGTQVTIDPITGLPVAGVGTGTGVTPSPTQPPVVSPGPALVAAGGVTQVTALSPAPTVGASLSAGGAVSYLDRRDTRFYRMDASGDITPLSDRQFPNVVNALISPTGTTAILEYPDGSNISYDFRTGQQVTLPRHWEEFRFSPDGANIAAKSIGTDESNRFLVVAAPDGAGARAVQELGNNAHLVTVAFSPTGQTVALAETGRATGPTSREIYLIGQYGENLRALNIEGFDFRPSWSPDGRQLLYSTASAGNDYKPTLWVVDAYGEDIGRNRRSLNVSTWSDKCTFASGTTLYCAVPRELGRGAGLQPGMDRNVQDDIFRIDIATGLQTRVAIPETPTSVSSLMLAPDGSALYFTDATTGILNRINLR